MKSLGREALDDKSKVGHTKIKKYNVWKTMSVEEFPKDATVLILAWEMNQK